MVHFNHRLSVSPVSFSPTQGQKQECAQTLDQEITQFEPPGSNARAKTMFPHHAVFFLRVLDVETKEPHHAVFFLRVFNAIPACWSIHTHTTILNRVQCEYICMLKSTKSKKQNSHPVASPRLNTSSSYRCARGRPGQHLHHIETLTIWGWLGRFDP